MKEIQYTIVLSLLFVLMVHDSYPQQGTVRGSVNGVDGALRRASVSLGDKTVLTDQQGRFSFFINPGKHTLFVTHSGYQKIVRDVSVEADNLQQFDITMTPDEQIGEVVVLGSRSATQRSNLNTAVPVDVFSSALLAQTGQTDLSQMLHYTAPSFNASRQSLNESITLRGLNPDQVLILLNGTRYHSMAWLNQGAIRGILGRSSVANDLNAIPFSAIEKIEILRDGSAAQYGSDAIAGVINIVLKKSTSTTTVQSHAGQHYEADGERISLGINHGMALNKKGFLNFSGNFRYQGPTFRGGAYNGTVFKNYPFNANGPESARIKALDDSLIKARNFNRKEPSNAGSSEFVSAAFLINGGYATGPQTNLFWTASVNKRTSQFIGGYRFPKNTNQVNTALHPDGFKPRVEQDSWSISGIAGINGATKTKWRWEATSAYGSNSGSYDALNTNNASQFALGKMAPTRFHTGSLLFSQLTNNTSCAKDFSKPTGRLRHLNLGFGSEYRVENFRVRAGEEAAWRNYDPSGRTQGGSQNGLGLHPDNALNKFRHVLGIYVDLEGELNEQLFIGLASRYEHYSDFGSNLAGKIAVRYKLTDQFAVRGSLSNGFRAPSIQQRYYSATSSSAVNSSGVLIPNVTGIFNNYSEVAKAFGIPPLQAENSLNLSAGITSSITHQIHITADAYWIQIRNRIILSDRFDKRTNPDVARILANSPYDQAQFFTDAINTRTYGVDVVLKGNWSTRKSNLGLTLAANYNRTRIFGKIHTTGKLTDTALYENTLLNLEERGRVERGQPRDKIILTLNYQTGRLEWVLRNTRFGKTAIIANGSNRSLDEFFSPRILTDFSISFKPRTGPTFTAGANNVFDVYPERIKNFQNTSEGMLHYGMEATPFGFNGGYYYVSLSFNW